MAKLCASMSRAQRLQVGCAIVKDNNIISHGWNGTPSGWDNQCETLIPAETVYDADSRSYSEYPERLVTKPEVLHAEMNALMKLARGSESGLGASMFVTHAPCIECAKGIYQAGIQAVYYGERYRSDQGLEFLKKSGVQVLEYQE